MGLKHENAKRKSENLEPKIKNIEPIEQKIILPEVLEYFRKVYFQNIGPFTNQVLVSDFNVEVQRRIKLDVNRLSRWIHGDENDLLKRDYLKIIIDLILRYITDQNIDIAKITAQIREKTRGEVSFKFMDMYEDDFQTGNHLPYLENLIRAETELYNFQRKGSLQELSYLKQNSPQLYKYLIELGNAQLNPIIVSQERQDRERKPHQNLKNLILSLYPGSKKWFAFLISIVLVIILGGIGIGLEMLSEPISPSIICEAEDYTQGAGLIRIEDKPHASGGTGVHFGPDSDIQVDGIGNTLEYTLEFPGKMPHGILEICYTDDVKDNLINVYLDNRKKGSFVTQSTGGWDNFILASERIDLGYISKGAHQLKLEIGIGGSWGVLIDYIKIFNTQPQDRVTSVYNHLKILVNPSTGLMQDSLRNKYFTTTSKNGLGAIAFIHQHDLKLAEGIFKFYQARFNFKEFQGFNKDWDPQTGTEGAKARREADNAFLLLALNQYERTTGSTGDFKEMRDGLVKWLMERVNDETVTSGLTEIYAALRPYKDQYPGMKQALSKLYNRFYAKKDFSRILDHVSGAALCFGDYQGFGRIKYFRRTETWECNGVEINLLSGDLVDNYVNVEKSARVLLAWKLRKSKLQVDASYLGKELEQLWLLSGSTPEEITSGLPYFVSEKARSWVGSYTESIIEPTCYMLFYYWGLNPFASD